jgi:hypothetical protein
MAKATKDFQRALALAARPDENWLELSELLAELVERDPTFRRQFEQQSRLNERTTYYFLKFGRQLRRLNLPRERLAKIGWSRWQAIHSRITPGNVRKLLKLAEVMTVAELQAELRGEGYKEKPRRVNLTFSQSDYAKFEQALLRHGARRSRGGRGMGLENKEEALIAIIEQVAPGAFDDD